MTLGCARRGYVNQGYTARDYVQDGLVAMWDGIENAGWGVHNPNATVWKDLVGGVELVLIETARMGEKSLVSVSKNMNAATAEPVASLKFPRTVEVVFKRDAGATGTMVVFGSGDLRSQPSRLVHSTASGLVRGMAGYGDMPVAQINVGAANTVAFVYSEAAYSTTITAAYLNGAASVARGHDTWGGMSARIGVGAYSNVGYGFQGDVFAVRLYDRPMTVEECAANCAIDKARFNLPD